MDKVVHFEIPASDMAGAQEFYSKIFGWQFVKYNDWYSTVRTVEVDENMMPKESGAINGGLQKRNYKAVSPTVVISVDDIDAKIMQIEKAGGKVVVPKEAIGDMGFYAQFFDPDGNRIGLFQASKKM